MPIRSDNHCRPSRQYQSVRKCTVDSVDSPNPDGEAVDTTNPDGEALSIQSTAQIRQDWHRRLVFQLLFVKMKGKDYIC